MFEDTKKNKQTTTNSTQIAYNEYDDRASFKMLNSFGSARAVVFICLIAFFFVVLLKQGAARRCVYVCVSECADV